MEKYHNTIQESNGDIVVTATVTIYNSVGGAIADIFNDDETTPLNNPFTVSDLNYNSDGSFWFKAANGDYNIKVVNGADTKWLYHLTLFDFEDATPPHDYTKTTDPTVNDDETQGWEIGSEWFNTVTKEGFKATDVSTGAAKWDAATLDIADLGTIATQDSDAVNISGGTIDNISALGVFGNIVVSGTVDGREVSNDGVQLDILIDDAVLDTDTSTASMQFVIDEDSFVSDLATKVPTQQSVKAFVAAQLVGALKYQGGYNAATNTPNLDSSPAGIFVGDSWTCTTAGTFFTVALEAGDFLIAEVDNPTVEADWTIVNKDLNAASILAALLTVDGVGSGLDADLLQGVAPDTTSTANTIVKRDSNGDVIADKFKMDDSATATNPTNIMVELNTGYIQKQTKANFISNLGLAILASPAFSGNPTAPTQTAGNNSTRLATTAFVTAAIAAASAASGFPSGTRMMFQQNAAPTGWTKETASAYGNAAFKNYNGTQSNTGGTGTFSSKFNSTVATSGGSVSNSSLSTAQLASHSHTITNVYTANGGSAGVFRYTNMGTLLASSTSAAGSGSTHGHSFTNPTFNQNVKWIGTIVAQKD